MNRYILLFYLNLVFCSDFLPPNSENFNYTQIFFKWPQIPYSNSYILNLTNQISLEEFSINCEEKNSIIVDQFINWESEYSWIVCGYDNQLNITDCFNESYFSINSLPDNFPDFINIISVDEEQYTPGITMLDFESLHFSAALNVSGLPVWFADRNEFTNQNILVTEFLANGNILGFNSGVGFEFNLDSEILFQTSNNDGYGVHHCIHKTNNDTYFLIDAHIQNRPCPQECDSDFPDEIPWKGDRFLEVDQAGNIIWEWNTFDYLSINEYNPSWINLYASTGTFDWTHSNSVYYNESNNTVYVSIRNLSRITAIDYSTKEIIWNIGNPLFMEDVYFQDYFNFSHQHSAQIIDGDEVLFFDNGRNNIPEISRCLEISFPENQEPELEWEYTLPDSMLTLSRGECDRLSNGHTLISAGRTGNVIELNNNDEIVWHLNVETENSSPIIDDSDVSIYRSERIDNLYPNAFSFDVENLLGLYNNYFIFSNQATLNIEIYNQGWISQNFTYELIDDADSLLFTENVFILNNDYTNVSIENIEAYNTSQYTIAVYPSNNNNKSQELSFSIESVIGDFDNDGIVNVIDIIIMVNSIIDNNFNILYDLNNDNIINILDVIVLVNIILDYE